MATKQQLKEYFSTGKKPTGTQFSALVDYIESNPTIDELGTDLATAEETITGLQTTTAGHTTSISNLQSGKADKSDLDDYAKTTDIPDVSGLQSKPSATLDELPTDEYGDPSNANITTDTFVDLGTLTEDVDLDVNDSKYELAIAFATGDTPHSIIPNAGYYASDTTIEANKSYLFSVCRNVIVVVETTEIE